MTNLRVWLCRLLLGVVDTCDIPAINDLPYVLFFASFDDEKHFRSEWASKQLWSYEPGNEWHPLTHEVEILTYPLVIWQSYAKSPWLMGKSSYHLFLWAFIYTIDYHSYWFNNQMVSPIYRNHVLAPVPICSNAPHHYLPQLCTFNLPGPMEAPRPASLGKRVCLSERAMSVKWPFPMCSIYGIFTYTFGCFLGKCRYIFHTWSVWVWDWLNIYESQIPLMVINYFYQWPWIGVSRHLSKSCWCPIPHGYGYGPRLYH